MSQNKPNWLLANRSYSMKCPACNATWEYSNAAEEIARKIDAAQHYVDKHGGLIPDVAHFGKHQCPNCEHILGLNGTVSCSECGYVPEESRA